MLRISQLKLPVTHTEEDLKKKIQKLWNQKELTEQYSKNCENISFDTIDEYCEKLLKIYR